MENKTLANQSLGLNNVSLESLTNGIGKAIEGSLDISQDLEYVKSITPKDGYSKKIEIITQATDMSSQEKLKAIDAADDKYLHDLKKNSDLCTDRMWVKVSAGLVIYAILVMMFDSSNGSNVEKSIIRCFSKA